MVMNAADFDGAARVCFKCIEKGSSVTSSQKMVQRLYEILNNENHWLVVNSRLMKDSTHSPVPAFEELLLSVCLTHPSLQFCSCCPVTVVTMPHHTRISLLYQLEMLWYLLLQILYLLLSE